MSNINTSLNNPEDAAFKSPQCIQRNSRKVMRARHYMVCLFDNMNTKYNVDACIPSINARFVIHNNHVGDTVALASLLK